MKNQFDSKVRLKLILCQTSKYEKKDEGLMFYAAVGFGRRA